MKKSNNPQVLFEINNNECYIYYKYKLNKGRKMNMCRFFDDCCCSCHLAPPCRHCTEHTCEHEDFMDICDECFNKKEEE